MTKTCSQCQQQFEITEDDLKFLEKLSPVFNGKKYLIPAPTFCPDCRLMKRLAFRNERSLYFRECSFSGQKIMSAYPAGTVFPVYQKDIWFSDKWDERDYGRDFDFNKPFFQQYAELQKIVTRSNLIMVDNENCDYSNISGWSKNCYLVFATGYCEDSMFLKWGRWAKNCLDGINVLKSENCYECVWCENCYNVKYARNSQNCSFSMFLYSCNNCQNCLFCSNLRNKEYCIYNQQFSKEEFEEKTKQYNLQTRNGIEKGKNEFEIFLKKTPRKNLNILNSENVTGDLIENSKNVYEGYADVNCTDVRYVQDAIDSADIMDTCYVGDRMELVYENIMTEQVQNSMSVFGSVDASNIYYCDNCFNSKNLFGCIGARSHREYCILNKQYTKEEYEDLVPRIIEHMQKGGEWGQFFQTNNSPHAFNETVSYEFFFLTKEQALAYGFSWKDEVISNIPLANALTSELLPLTIAETDKSILDKVIICKYTGKPFKITPQELAFYMKNNLPVPDVHPNERHRRRLALMNKRKLRNTKCSSCNMEINTTYGGGQVERVLCEECFQKEVY